MILDHYRTDHVHVTDAADDGQPDHNQQSGNPTPFHAQCDRWHRIAIHQWSIVYGRRTQHRFDDGRRRLVKHGRHAEIAQHGDLREKNSIFVIIIETLIMILSKIMDNENIFVCNRYTACALCSIQIVLRISRLFWTKIVVLYILYGNIISCIFNIRFKTFKNSVSL